MKLRNKKTGKLIDINLSVNMLDEDCITVYGSLEEFNEDWEDYEEPKEYWYIDYCGCICDSEKEPVSPVFMLKEIGNYFETREEAEKVVEKLKAWNRLKKGGFRFISWDSEIEGEDHFDCCGMVFITGGFGEGEKCKKDLDLLFGGEE